MKIFDVRGEMTNLLSVADRRRPGAVAVYESRRCFAVKFEDAIVVQDLRERTSLIMASGDRLRGAVGQFRASGVVEL